MSDRGDAETPGDALADFEERLRRLERLVHDHHHDHGNLLGLGDDDHTHYLFSREIKTALAPTNEIAPGNVTHQGMFWRGGPFPDDNIRAAAVVVDDTLGDGLRMLRVAGFDRNGLTAVVINDDSVARSGTLMGIGVAMRADG